MAPTLRAAHAPGKEASILDRSAAGPCELAPQNQPEGGEFPTWAGRLGPRTGAAAEHRQHSAAAQPRAKAGAAGRDWPTSRLGWRSEATSQSGTDVGLR